MAAVPVPKTSLNVPFFSASVSSFMTIFLSVTLSFSGRPGIFCSPLACARASSRTLSRQNRTVPFATSSPITGNTGENNVVQGGSHELDSAVGLLDGDEQVHGSDLGEHVLIAKQPEVLAVTLLGGLGLGHDTRRVAIRSAGPTRNTARLTLLRACTLRFRPGQL